MVIREEQNSLANETTVQVRVKVLGGDARKTQALSGRRLATILLMCLALSSAANQALARWLGLSQNAPWTAAQAVYRRVGSTSGPQVFCAGSSLLVSGLSWPEVSEALGQGIENWTVAGSSPEVWKTLQQNARNSNTTLIGVSAYDLNEMRLTPERARFVPLKETVNDLWTSRTDFDLSHRILSQYAMLYLRTLYPLAGDADKVLVALRSKYFDLMGQQASLQQHEGVVVEKDGVLGVEDGATALSDWSSARVLRRIDALRAENHGAHKFQDGPKSRALRQVLRQAQQQGRVIVVVLPVSQDYTDAFLGKSLTENFEKALKDDMADAQQATVIRLDKVPGISDNRYFLDPVHLNSSGRRIVTPLFLQKVKDIQSARSEQSSSVRPLATANLLATDKAPRR